MRRPLAIFVLGFGLLPVALLLEPAFAGFAQQQQWVRLCRDKLGIAQTEPLYGALMFNLRRCINNERKQVLRAREFESSLQRYDQQFWRRYEYGQNMLKESQKSLNRRMETQEQLRKDFYHNTTLLRRDELLRSQRSIRRLRVRELERQIVTQRVQQRDRYLRAISECRNVSAALKYRCIHDFSR